jgi:hypothetical protein
LIPILKSLYMDEDNFLEPIKNVEVSYAWFKEDCG